MNRITLNIIQLALGLTLTLLILIQSQGGGLGSTFGGFGGFYRSKRGLEKLIYVSTIIVAALFFGLALVNFILFI